MSEYRWAIAAIGAALVALFVAAAATGAAGNTIPTQLWAAAGALSGALVGVLVPPPGTNSAAAAGASVINAAAVNAARATAIDIISNDQKTGAEKDDARRELDEVIAVTERRWSRLRTRAAIEKAIGGHVSAEAVARGPVKKAAADAASNAKDDATAAANAAPSGGLAADFLKFVVPAIVFGGAMSVGILLLDGTISYKSCSATVVLQKGQTAAPCASAMFQAGNALITLASTTAGTLVGLFAPTPSKSQ
jgi:hypothetical protein